VSGAEHFPTKAALERDVFFPAAYPAFFVQNIHRVKIFSPNKVRIK